jgi:hypothetical protein
MIPMVEEAQRRSMEVVILNPNSAFLYWNKVNHAKSVFEKHIIPGSGGNVWVVAHSFGGLCILGVVGQWPRWSIEHIRAIGVTDGVETQVSAAEWQINRWAHIYGVNWVSSTETVNSEMGSGPSFSHRSAGTTDHALTTGSAFQHVWEFFDSRASASRALESEFVGGETLGFARPKCDVS